MDQVYSNTRLQHESVRVNTNQHESHDSQRESIRVRHESTRINTSPTPVNTSQDESTRVNMSQLDQEIIIIYCSLVDKV